MDWGGEAHAMIPTPRPLQMPPLPRAELSDLPRRSARLCRGRHRAFRAKQTCFPGGNPPRTVHTAKTDPPIFPLGPEKRETLAVSLRGP